MSVLWDNYAKTTAHLSMIEHGAYRLLLDHYMQNGSKIKADEKQLLRICRAFAKEEKEALLSVLGQFFELREEHYFHSDAEDALAKRAKLAAIRARAGAIGGAKRRAKPEANHEANGKQLLDTSLLSSLRSQKEENSRKRAGSPKAPAPLAASSQQTPSLPVDTRWEAQYPKWSKVRAVFGDEVWMRMFADCRPNGSETTLICRSKFWAEKLESQLGDKLEKLFGCPITFKVEDPTKEKRQ